MIEIAAHINSVTVEAVDIFTHYFFLHPAQVGVEHEEVE